MKILIEGKKQEDMMYRVQCPYCHGIFEGTAKELSDPCDIRQGYHFLQRIVCPCCGSSIRHTQSDGATLNPDIIRCLDTSLDDLENPKKQGLQKKEDI